MRYRLEALERFVVRTSYDVEAASGEEAERLCKTGKAAYDSAKIEEGDEEWLETVEIEQQQDGHQAVPQSQTVTGDSMRDSSISGQGERTLKLLLDVLDPSCAIDEDAVYVEIDDRLARRVLELAGLLEREGLTEACLGGSAELFSRVDLADALEIAPESWEDKLSDQPYVRLPDDLSLPPDLDTAKLELTELCIREKFACWKLYVKHIEHVIETREIPLGVFREFQTTPISHGPSAPEPTP